jgi:hypothetical protein
MKAYAGCTVTPKRRHTLASVSARWVNSTRYLSMNRCMAGTWSWAATPTKVMRSPFSLASRATSPASPWHRGHHGAQNHSTAGLPARLEPSKSRPSTVLAVNRS